MSKTINGTTTANLIPGYELDYHEDDLVQPYNEIMEQLQDSSFKGAAVHNDLELAMTNYKKPRDQQRSYHQLERKLLSYNFAVNLPNQKSILLSTVKCKINQLIEGGFFNHWLEPYLNDRSLVEKEEEDDRVVLTIDHLSVGFTIWLGMLLIAIMAFLAELVWFHFSKLVVHNRNKEN